MQTIGAELYSSSAHGAGTLKWDEPHAGYGFPLPSSQRDRYEGKDRLL